MTSPTQCTSSHLPSDSPRSIAAPWRVCDLSQAGLIASILSQASNLREISFDRFQPFISPVYHDSLAASVRPLCIQEPLRHRALELRARVTGPRCGNISPVGSLPTIVQFISLRRAMPHPPLLHARS